MTNSEIYLIVLPLVIGFGGLGLALWYGRGNHTPK